MADRAAPDVRLGDLVHRDRGHDPGRDADPLEGVLEGEAVHDRREHADVVAGRPVHAARRGGQAAEDVAATDDDADLDAQLVRPRRPGSAMNAQNAGIDAVRAIAEEGLAGQLEQDPPVAHRRRPPATVVAAGVAHSSSPSA